ncbi:MAG: hypothetical protein H0T15_08805 [Thermoleophilaceae bacterium]|nr:hypothetical protein [Thermoleophilaceae bacterium]
MLRAGSILYGAAVGVAVIALGGPFGPPGGITLALGALLASRIDARGAIFGALLALGGFVAFYPA